MKDFLIKLGVVIISFAILPVAMVAVIVWSVFYVPFEFFRYHRTWFYKDTRRRYELFITSFYFVQTYDRLIEKGLPIRYFRSDDLEYFVLDGMVLLSCWDYENAERKDGEWYFSLDDDGPVSMKEGLAMNMEMVRLEHRDLPAKFLVIGDEMDAHKECPYFYCLENI